MVARTAHKRQSFEQIINKDWRQQLRDSAITPEKLLQRLNLPNELLDGMQAGSRLFPLRVPEAFIQRMQSGDRFDPLLRQVLPLMDETFQVDGYIDDPVGDLRSNAAPGVLHKYHGRALLMVTGACAVNCRYCFRRAFPYSEQQIKPAQWLQTLDYLRLHDDINEIILSGGDPLVLSTERLQALCNELKSIPHLRRLRIHTRLPVMIPERITTNLCEWLGSLPWPVCIVLHINHHQEINTAFKLACKRIRATGTTLLNQAVLLKGVNDSDKCQRILSERLYDAGIIPYYLHQLDPVSGSQHFKVEDQQALEIYASMQRYLPGYLLPRLVKEVPGQPSKLPLKQ